MRRLLVSALAVPVLFLSACGSEEEPEVTEPTAEETTDAEETTEADPGAGLDDGTEETEEPTDGGDDAGVTTEDDTEQTTEDDTEQTTEDAGEETTEDNAGGGEDSSGEGQAAADRTKEWFVAFVNGEEKVCDYMLDFSGEGPMKDSAEYDQCKSMIPGMVGEMFTPEMVSVIESMEINGATVEGDTATVGKDNLSDLFAEGFGDTAITLKKIDGEWFVDLNSLNS